MSELEAKILRRALKELMEARKHLKGKSSISARLDVAQAFLELLLEQCSKGERPE